MKEHTMSKISHPLSLRNITITDKFWKKEMELVRKEVIPYQWDALNDRVAGAAPSFCMRNYKLAGKITKARKELGKAYEEKVWPLIFETLPEDMDHMEDRFYGFLFQDSDFSKWIEAVAYSLTQHPDKELEAVADEAIAIVCAAQQENGYLDTYYIINDMSKVFTNLKDNHELYCFGHLTEGAVAYYQATGKDALLRCAQRYADYLSECFGPGEGQMKGYPGHEIAEMALVRLYEVTGDEKYLNLCKFFLDERGVRPYYFDMEAPEKVKPADREKIRYHYHQAHVPVREQDEAVGHAVRAVYLYSGMADVARLTGDEAMLSACEKLWDNIVNQKMYITGGIGGTHIGEAFSFDYDLPNDTAYAETCASIGLVFFARRMLEIRANSKYSDVMERALYNGVLSGIALDGKSFFYVNPLEVLPEACHKDERKFHVKPVRQKWFGCACCPPNIARLLSSIASYAYTENDEALFTHLYIGGEIEKEFATGKVHFSVESNMPWNGDVNIRMMMMQDTKFTLALRIPEWCDTYIINDMQGTKEGSFEMDDTSCEVKDGYLYIRKVWKNGDTLSLDFGMPIRMMRSHSALRENAGRVALMRGPIVYCIEEADNGKNLQNVCVDISKPAIHLPWQEVSKDMVTLYAHGRRYEDDESTDALYTEYTKPAYKETALQFVPYFAWNNRGEGEMMVWVRGER